MSEFFAMGGHGFFIWVSFGVTALLMVIEVIALKRSRRTLLKQLARLARVDLRKGQRD